MTRCLTLTGIMLIVGSLSGWAAQPQQSFQQMGETAIVSKAIADPVASRLERVFGVSQLKIDPTFTSGSDLPQARVTLQQQVATNLVFTYVTALEDPNTQIVRIEWTFNPAIESGVLLSAGGTPRRSNTPRFT